MSDTETSVRRTRGPRAAHTPGSLSKVLSLVGRDQFARVCEEHKDDPVFQKALSLLGKKNSDAAALAGPKDSAKVTAGRGCFVNTAAIGAMPGDTVKLSLDGDAIVIRKA